jgi:hypothetical protein
MNAVDRIRMASETQLAVSRCRPAIGSAPADGRYPLVVAVPPLGYDMVLNGGELTTSRGKALGTATPSVPPHPSLSSAVRPHTQPAGLGRFLQVGPGPPSESRPDPPRTARAIRTQPAGNQRRGRRNVPLGAGHVGPLCPAGRHRPAFLPGSSVGPLSPSVGSRRHHGYNLLQPGLSPLSRDPRGSWPVALAPLPANLRALTQKWNIPDGGAMPPLLPVLYLPWPHLSAYGWFLVAVFARLPPDPTRTLLRATRQPPTLTQPRWKRPAVGYLKALPQAR